MGKPVAVYYTKLYSYLDAMLNYEYVNTKNPIKLFVHAGNQNGDIMSDNLIGLRVVFDGARPLGQRVVEVTVRCIECNVPRYEPLVLDKYYRVVTNDFVGNGGGDYTMLSENRINIEVVGVDYDILMEYIRQQTPVFVEADGRMQISSPCVV